MECYKNIKLTIKNIIKMKEVIEKLNEGLKDPEETQNKIKSEVKNLNIPVVNGSALIAEFLGSKFINDDPEDYPNGYYYQPEGIEEDCPIGEPDDWYFNSSWDWLLPVYRKIRDIINERSKYDKHTRTNYDLLELDVQTAICEVDIEKAFDSTVKFIEYWNASQADR